MTVTTDFLDGVSAAEGADYERRQQSRDNDSAAERLAGMMARRSGGHKCPKDSGGTYFACLDRNHRRDRYSAGYLLKMILPDPETTGLPEKDDYVLELNWHSVTKDNAPRA